MALELTGKLILKLAEQKGTSKAGKEWTKQDFVIETTEQFPRKICMNVFGEKVEMLRNIPVGSDLKIAINLESREWNGKWFTDVRAWRIEVVAGNGTVYNDIPSQESVSDMPQSTVVDDLPF